MKRASMWADAVLGATSMLFLEPQVRERELRAHYYQYVVTTEFIGCDRGFRQWPHYVE